MRIDMGWYALTWQIVVERQLIKHAARFVKVAVFSDRLLQMNRLCLLVILERMENGSEVYRGFKTLTNILTWHQRVAKVR